MKVFWGNDDIDTRGLQNAVVTIGNFDGCHMGHQEIFSKVRRHAARIGGAAIVYTFDPHPASVIKGVVPELIFTVDEKIEAISALGMDAVILAPFTREFANTNPEVFIKDIIIRRISAHGIVVGHDFSFGRDGVGDIPFLERMGRKMGFFVESVKPVESDGIIVSSTCIRRMILSGDVSGAARVMKHPFRISGPVVHGMSRGRTLGYPTANIRPDKELIPAYGVYAVYIHLKGNRYKGVVNIGNNPTFGDVGTSIEAYIFDLDEDIYDADISIEFIEHIRGEIKFADKLYLIEQIEADCARAKELLQDG